MAIVLTPPRDINPHRNHFSCRAPSRMHPAPRCTGNRLATAPPGLQIGLPRPARHSQISPPVRAAALGRSRIFRCSAESAQSAVAATAARANPSPRPQRRSARRATTKIKAMSTSRRQHRSGHSLAEWRLPERLGQGDLAGKRQRPPRGLADRAGPRPMGARRPPLRQNSHQGQAESGFGEKCARVGLAMQGRNHI